MTEGGGAEIEDVGGRNAPPRRECRRKGRSCVSPLGKRQRTPLNPPRCKSQPRNWRKMSRQPRCKSPRRMRRTWPHPRPPRSPPGKERTTKRPRAMRCPPGKLRKLLPT